MLISGGGGLGQIGSLAQYYYDMLLVMIGIWRGRKDKTQVLEAGPRHGNHCFPPSKIANLPVRRKAELWISPFLRCFNSIL